MKIQDIQKIVDSLTNGEHKSPVHVKGSKFQRDRINKICDMTLKNYTGDILEIGCHTGLTTIKLCELARKHNRQVHAVDPWNGDQQGNERVYQQFIERTSDYSDVLTTHRMKSDHPDVKQLVESGNFCFSFVDGLHTYNACKQDIKLCSINTGVMCVDDLGYLPDLLRLFHEMQKAYNFQSYFNSECREGYYIVT